jgi:hypothetical protein
VIIHELLNEFSGPTIPNRQWQRLGHSSAFTEGTR